MPLHRSSPLSSRSCRVWLGRALLLASGIALQRAPKHLLPALPVAVVVAARLWRDAAAARPRSRRWSDGVRRRARAGLAILAWAVAGWVVGRSAALRDPAPAVVRGWCAEGFVPWMTPVGLRGRVEDVERLPDDRCALTLSLRSIRLPGHGWRPVGPRLGARLTVPIGAPAGPGAAPPWRPGASLEVDARIGPPRGFRDPGGFDVAAYDAARGIDLVGSIKSRLLIRARRHARLQPAFWPPSIRLAIVRRLERAAGADGGDTAAFLAALLVGERASIPDRLRDDLQRAGVFHIVALSGFNIAVATGLLGAILRLGVGDPRRRRALLLAGVMAYCALARDSGSMSRAALMAAVHLAAAMAARRARPVATLGVSAALLLATRPDLGSDAGFQLSCLATLALVLGATGAAARPPASGRRSSRPIADSLRTSATVLWWTSPLSALHFQRLTPAALVANLIAVPIAALLVALGGAIAAIGDAAPCLAAAMVRLAGFLILLLGRSCGLMAAIPGGWFHVVPPRAGAVVAIVAVLLLAAAAGRRHRRLLSAVAFVLLLRIPLAHRWPAPAATLAITALDVGQGDAVLVRFPDGLAMLVDAGGLSQGEFDVGARVVAPALRAMGLLRLDILAITHAHRDHLGGAASIVRELRPRAIWLGRMPPRDPAVGEIVRLAAERGIPVVMPRRGVSLSMGGARVTVLNPAREAGEGANDDSLVLRVAWGMRSALLTGDIEAATEGALVRSHADLGADLLKVAHHGSRTSTTAPFLSRCHPSVAVISAGVANRWGHPDPEVVARLRAAGTAIFVTASEGAVRFTTDGFSPWRARILVVGSTGAACPGRTTSP